jgi:hypothetical protein
VSAPSCRARVRRAPPREPHDRVHKRSAPLQSSHPPGDPPPHSLDPRKSRAHDCILRGGIGTRRRRARQRGDLLQCLRRLEVVGPIVEPPDQIGRGGDGRGRFRSACARRRYWCAGGDGRLNHEIHGSTIFPVMPYWYCSTPATPSPAPHHRRVTRRPMTGPGRTRHSRTRHQPTTRHIARATRPTPRDRPRLGRPEISSRLISRYRAARRQHQVRGTGAPISTASDYRSMRAIRAHPRAYAFLSRGTSGTNDELS